MPFCFVGLRKARDHEGWEPDFPDGVACSFVADLRQIGWAIYEYAVDEANEGWEPQSPVSDELGHLIESAKRYPPALAIGRDDMRQVFEGRCPTQREFADALADSLRKRLAQQPAEPFVLACAVGGDGFYVHPGEWYWVLRTRRDPPTAWWVSDDYFIYADDLRTFALTVEQIERLCER